MVITHLFSSDIIIGCLIPIYDKVKVSKSGLMDQCMKDGGKITKPMERVDSFMLMGIFMMAIGKMTRLMDTVYIHTWMEPDMKVTGKKINSMERV